MHRVTQLALVLLACSLLRAPVAASPEPRAYGRRFHARDSGAEPVVLTLRSDSRVTLERRGRLYEGLWRETAGVRCVRFWDDEGPRTE